MRIAHILPGLVIAIAALGLSGCGDSTILLLDPDGPVARDQSFLLKTATLLMLIVIVPVFILAFWFARQYRASNSKARYEPDWRYSLTLDAVVWLVPALIVVGLGYLVWTHTHRLDPYRQIDSAVAPLEIEAVAQDWKWLFIYPEHNVATVNELVFPVDRPVRVKLTSDTVMNSFYVAGLAGQIYAMAGMRTELNFWADRIGTFTGRNMQYSGDGFSDQTFAVRAESTVDFDSWIARVRQSQLMLDGTTYDTLASKAAAMAVTHYGGVAPGLFDDILGKYRGSGDARANPSAHGEH